MNYLIFFILALTAMGCAATVSQNNVAEAPMDLSSGRPVVEVFVNGEGPFPFVIDTGAPRGGMLSSETVEALNLKPVGQQQIGSPLGGEPVDADLYQIDVLEIAGAESRDFQLASISAAAANGMGANVIGPALFDDGLVTFDFQNNILRIGGTAPDDVTWIEFGDSAPILDGIVTIKGAEMEAHIDSGAPHIVTLPNAYADTLALDGPPEVIGRARTIDKEFDISRAPLDAEITIGDARIPITSVLFGPLPFVNIGTGGLRGLVLTIDWPNERYAIVGEATPQQLMPRRAPQPVTPRQ